MDQLMEKMLDRKLGLVKDQVLGGMLGCLLEI